MNAKLDHGLEVAFVAEAGEHARRLGVVLVRLEAAPGDRTLLDAAFRSFHAIKGGAAFLPLDPVVRLCHRCEDLLNAARGRGLRLGAPEIDALLDGVDALEAMIEAQGAGRPVEAPSAALLARLAPRVAAVVDAPAAAPARGLPAVDDDEFEALLDGLYGAQAPGFAPPRAPAAPAAATCGPDAPDARAPELPQFRPLLRVEAARLDALVDGVAELQSLRRRLHVMAGRDATLADVSGELDRLARELEASVLALRMQPVAQLFERYPRVVRGLARRLGKEVDLDLAGTSTDLDRGVADALGEPLVHLLRNALDHGIGTPDERERAGKPRRGRIELAAEQRGGAVVVSVRDDGRGMDAESLRRRAVALGFLTDAAAAKLTAAECQELVFRPGFTTAAAVSETSGRGVGMDAVRTAVEELGGSVRVHSVTGAGTTVELEIPLTLSVLRVQVVRAGTQLYALPAADIEDGFTLDAGQVGSSGAAAVLRRRGQALPLANLAAWTAPGAPAGHQVIVVRHGVMRLACLVDAVFPREDVLVRALGPMLARVPGISGAAVTADGGVALVVAPAGLIDASGAPLQDIRMQA